MVCGPDSPSWLWCSSRVTVWWFKPGTYAGTGQGDGACFLFGAPAAARKMLPVAHCLSPQKASAKKSKKAESEEEESEPSESEEEEEEEEKVPEKKARKAPARRTAATADKQVSNRMG